MPIRSHWCVALGCLLAAGWSMPRECLSDVALGQRYCLPAIRRPEQKPLRPERSQWCGLPRSFRNHCPCAAHLKGLTGFRGLLKGFPAPCTFKARAEGFAQGLSRRRTPIRSYWCVALGCLVAAGWSMPRECLSDVALGQRYWLPAIRRPERSHWCGLRCLLADRWVWRRVNAWWSG